MIEPQPLLEVTDLTVTFRNPHRGLSEPARLRVLDGITLSVQPGEVLGLVGESGSGKTTLGKAMLRLYRPSQGHIVFEGRDITALGEAGLRPFRRALQMVFQDPLSSFNPRVPIGEALRLPLRLHQLCPPAEMGRAVDRLLARVGLPTGYRSRLPHQLSGGQLQRVAIARALALQPRLIVADEPVSKLDVSIRAQILNLFRDVQQETGVALVFITHDLRVARFLCDRIAVMFFGRVVEVGPAKAIFTQPHHPYTERLIGQLTQHPNDNVEPAPPADDSGCRYRSRCPRASDICGQAVPTMRGGGGVLYACHNPLA